MRFRQVILQARDPVALAAWYRGTLGLPAGGERASVVAGATTLRFEAAPEGIEPQYHFAFNIPENRVEDALRWIGPRAPIIEHTEGPVVDFPAWDAHSIYFSDPAGNVCEIIARHALRNAGTSAFDSSSILSVSEVGLPCPSVPALVAELKRALGVPEYRPASEQFAPLGDEHGLLIVVPQGREWFPGKGARRTFPVDIVHEGPAHDVPGLPFRFVRA